MPTQTPTPSPREFKYLSPEVLRDLGDKFNKDLVVVFVYDQVMNATTVATWGRSSQDKERAASMGDEIINVYKLVPASDLPTIDFRTRTNAELMAQIDELNRRIAHLEEKLNAGGGTKKA